MTTLTLRRLESNDYATYGHLLDAENRALAATLELPWRENRKDVSCIPAGMYTAKRRYSPEHKCQLFALVDVPDRDDVEIHAGCLPRDSKGCILTGAAFGFVDYADGKPGASGHGVTDARLTFTRFMAAMDSVDEFQLQVVDPPVAV